MTAPEIQQDQTRLESILSGDEYTAYAQGAGKSGVLRWLSDMWEKLLDWFPDWQLSKTAGQWSAYAVVAVLLLALAAVIVWLSRSMLLARRDRRRTIFNTAGELELSSTQLSAEAEELAGQKQYREAFRRLFLALLLLMHEREWVQAERWKTNREYREELAERQPAAAADFMEAAMLFERVYYGRAAAVEPDFRAMRQCYARLAPKEGRA